MPKEEVYKIISDYYKVNFKKLVNKTVGKTGSRHNAEDAVQEAFTRALTYWESFNPNGSFDMWFDKILGNSVRNLNSEARSKGMTHPDTISPPPINPAYLKRFLKEIKEEIDKRPEDRRKILSLAFFDEYTPLEISHITNKTVNAIRIIMFRFREDIRLKYGSHLYG